MADGYSSEHHEISQPGRENITKRTEYSAMQNVPRCTQRRVPQQDAPSRCERCGGGWEGAPGAQQGGVQMPKGERAGQTELDTRDRSAVVVGTTYIQRLRLRTHSAQVGKSKL